MKDYDVGRHWMCFCSKPQHIYYPMGKPPSGNMVISGTIWSPYKKTLIRKSFLSCQNSFLWGEIRELWGEIRELWGNRGIIGRNRGIVGRNRW